MADFNSQSQKAFDFCADASKQLIILSTAIIAFMVTFAKEFTTTVPQEVKNLAYWAWSLHILSMCLGILVLLALTAQLEPITQSTDTASQTTPTIRGAAATYSFLQIITFVSAMILSVWFGINAGQSGTGIISQQALTTTKPEKQQHQQSNKQEDGQGKEPK